MNQTASASFTEQMQFSKSWRSYQARVLENLPAYLDDQHFHLISAPGSGKTVIGLEVVRQIGQPTLVLAPTLAIREQWVNRLTTDYLANAAEPDWLSRELSDPKDLTIITYQSLYSEFKKPDGEKKCLKQLGRAGITTIVVDEAHHLRASWWKCLAALKENIPSPTIVALTATPPIDVPATERQRYESFCGPVDVEVGVPELVAENNLCPHQDYVLLSVPTGQDQKQIELFQQAVNSLATELNAHQQLAKSLVKKGQPIDWLTIEDNTDFLKEHQAFFIALAIFLRSHRQKIPESIRDTYQINGKELPKQLDLAQSEALLNGLIFPFRDRLSSATNELLQPLEQTARTIGAIEKDQVLFISNHQHEKLLRDSASKLGMIQQIVAHELESQADAAQIVILSDYIRNDEPADAKGQYARLGVIPIFETLWHGDAPNQRLGVLTGSIVIIPTLSRETLIDITTANGVDPESISTIPHGIDPNYIEITVRDSDQQRLVAAVTELFEIGQINCLVGTAALLGEGWDAPTLNTLILASVIGSFVMSNQMRGRAIRTDPANPDKVANIWHIATIAPKFDYHYDPGPDFARLQRRFEVFHGVGYDLDDKGFSQVQSGWARIGIEPNMTPAKAEIHNKRMLRLAKQREITDYTWKRAIAPIIKGKQMRAVSELCIPKSLITHQSGWFKNWRTKKVINQITKTVFISLAELDLLSSVYKKQLVEIKFTADTCQITAPKLDPSDQSKFISSLQQFFDTLNSPRYLICQKGRFYRVPNLLAGTKHSANRFSKNLEESKFGEHQLHYIYSDDGNVQLLAARKQMLLMAEDTPPVEVRISWVTA